MVPTFCPGCGKKVPEHISQDYTPEGSLLFVCPICNWQQEFEAEPSMRSDELDAAEPLSSGIYDAIVTRPMTPEERQRLEQALLPPEYLGDAFFGCGCISLFFTGVFGLLLWAFPVILPVGIIWGVILLAATLKIGWDDYFSRKAAWKHLRPLVLQDLGAEPCEVQTFCVREAFEILDTSENRYGYALHVPTDRVLFMAGDYLGAQVFNKEFPSSEFEVVRGLQSKVCLNLVIKGTYIPPTRENVPEIRDKTIRLRDGEFLPITWSAFTANP